MLFVIDFLEPVGQKDACIFGPNAAPGTVLQIIDVAAKFLQRTHRLGRQHRAQRIAEQRLKQTEFVGVGKGAQRAQRGVANAAFRRFY